MRGGGPADFAGLEVECITARFPARHRVLLLASFEIGVAESEKLINSAGRCKRILSHSKRIISLEPE